MRIETVDYKIYTYDELSETAKEKVKEWLLEGREAEWFTDECKMYLDKLFPGQELEVEYSLNYRQGDGFNIYGKISHKSLWEKVKDQFEGKEERFMSWVINHYGYSYTMPQNHGYGYCMSAHWNFVEGLIDDMEYGCIRGIKYDIMEKFDNACKSYMEKLCDDFEKSGYDYFYEISDEEARELCFMNGYEFMENGSIFW